MVAPFLVSYMKETENDLDMEAEMAEAEKVSQSLLCNYTL